jgi:Rha family phage regulatory protein
VNDLTPVFTKDDRPMTDSLRVAEYFNKEHFHVMRDVETLECSTEFRQSNYGLSSYRNAQNKKQPCISMTFDGFIFLAMGYRGKRAASIKERYIREFNRMSDFLRQLSVAKSESKDLTEAIKMAHAEIHAYHFSNEFDLINRIVLGESTKKFRTRHGITGDSIRPFLTPEQLEQVTKLQRFDAGLVVTTPRYDERKRILTDYHNRISKKVLTA